jgi:hypothetical protein
VVILKPLLESVLMVYMLMKLSVTLIINAHMVTDTRISTVQRDCFSTRSSWYVTGHKMLIVMRERLNH